jgi:hypothetical protein
MQAQLDKAKEIAQKISDCEVRPYFTYEYGRKKDSSGISVFVDRKSNASPEKIMAQLRCELPDGLLAFVGTNNALDGEEFRGVEVAIGPGKTQFDILRLARTDAVNHNKTTEDIIQKLAAYDLKYGIEITHATKDSVVFRVLEMPENAQTFVRDINDFCPDTLIAGFDACYADIIRHQRVGLWWD